MQGNVKPLGDRVLIERLDGDGREQTSKGGIILPAHDASLRRGNSKRVPDTYRARVLAVSVEAARLTQGELAPGVEAIVHTYDNNDADRTLAGEGTRFGMIVRVDDIIGVVEPRRGHALEFYMRGHESDAIVGDPRRYFEVDMNVEVEAADGCTPPDHTAACSAIFNATRDAGDAEREAALNESPLLGMIPKTREHEPPQAIMSLGFHRKVGF